MRTPPPSRDLARITLAVLFIGLMIVASLWIVQPFIGATIWATMVVVATWPIMLTVQKRLGGRRWLAVTVMTLAMLLVLVVPLVLAVVTIVDHRDEIADWFVSLATDQDPLAARLGGASAARWAESRPGMAAVGGDRFGGARRTGRALRRAKRSLGSRARPAALA